MLPTFEVNNEWILISKLYRYGRGIQVGDLVNYKIPIEPHAEGIKRVVGLPGDYVLIDSPDSGSDAMIQVGHAHLYVKWNGKVLTLYRYHRVIAGWWVITYRRQETRERSGLFLWLWSGARCLPRRGLSMSFSG